MTDAFTIIKILLELRRLRRHNNWKTNQIISHQEKSLYELRQYAYHHSPFYQSFHKGLGNAPLAELPILTKSIMMDHFDDFVTDRNVRLADVKNHLDTGRIERFHNKYEVAATSGSTGNPGIFLYDKREWTTVIASFARAREWAGLKVNLVKRSKMAVVSSTNERNISAKVGRAVNTRFVPTLRIDATEPVEVIVAKLNEWKPDALVSYASMAYFLANEQEKGRLNIHPKFIFTASEVLTVEMREIIERVWGKVVFNEYAATETATIAAEDTCQSGMHVFEDLLIVENVDEHNKPVKVGEFGSKILVSVLFSKTQPLIRYEISDNVQFANIKPCSLAYSIIDGVQGRQEDVLVMPGIEAAEVRVHPNVFHDFMLTIYSKGWQVIQGRDDLRILVIDPGEDLAQVENRISNALKIQGVRVPKIYVDKVDFIPKDKSGKSPLVKRYKP